MTKTTIQVNNSTLTRLKRLKTYSKQSYDELLNKVIDDFEEEILSDEEINEIKTALDNVKKGKVKSIEKVAMELGVDLK